MYRDIYHGFEIDYSPEHEGYQVMYQDKVLHTAQSYDDAMAWIDITKHRLTGVYLELALHVAR